MRRVQRMQLVRRGWFGSIRAHSSPASILVGASILAVLARGGGERLVRLSLRRSRLVCGVSELHWWLLLLLALLELLVIAETLWGHLLVGRLGLISLLLPGRDVGLVVAVADLLAGLCLVAVADALVRVVPFVLEHAVSVLHLFVHLAEPLPAPVNDVILGHLHLLAVFDDRAGLKALCLHALSAQIPRVHVALHLAEHAHLLVHHVFHLLHHLSRMPEAEEVVFVVVVKEGARHQRPEPIISVEIMARRQLLMIGVMLLVAAAVAVGQHLPVSLIHLEKGVAEEHVLVVAVVVEEREAAVPELVFPEGFFE